MVSKDTTRLLIGSVHNLPERLGKTVRIGEKEVAVFRLSSGRFRAVENRCPHKGGVFSEGMVSGEFVFCPMYDWKICLDDGNVQAPDKGCVKTYKTEVEGENVYFLF
ncbi:nitrite reductase small subunit NirD [Jeotgalibacillus soli]|uniref:Nitrite reductase NAD(P)H small subunit n=1 Tax=Jeotgalibacillus soli TaxID=889306 RepID=A0A0C2RGM5_9BACL|nr:nitrite reductase small subunit NirD [Jeotgalibacillus soli]KIL49335.1 nitrite reductase NAD(P)H small subunit [Jeotgalibacillus soli]